jgi:hypothetical protein
MLTLKKLKEMTPGKVFAQGVIKNSLEGIYMTDSRIGENLMWVAKRGGIYDWAIYIHWEISGFNYVLTSGDKVQSKEYIQKLIPCDKEALKMYRH